MKKFFTKNVWMLLCASVLLFGCDEHDYDAAEFFAFPVISASVEGATKTEISRDNMTIRVIYDEVVDVTQVPLEVELEPGVTFVTPSSASETFDLTEPQSLVLSSGNRLITYTVSAVFDIDTSEPIETFTASAPTELYGDKEGVVEIDNGVRTITITFDYVVDLTKVNVGYTFFNESDITDATPSGEWDLSDAENPKEFSFKVRGLEVTYLVRATVNVSTSINPIVSFSSEGINATVNNTASTISILPITRTAGNFSSINVDYTLAEGVTAISPASKVWNLTQPVEFKLDVRGVEITYTATAMNDKEFSIITNNIPSNVKLLKLEKWKGEAMTTTTAYAVVINSTGSAKLSVVGEGYGVGQMQTMSGYAAANPDAKFVITGSNNPSLLVVNGVVKHNVVSTTDGDGCLSVDANQKFYNATSTNRAGGTVDGALGNTIYWWDGKNVIPSVYTAGKGNGHLNVPHGDGGLISTGETTKAAQVIIAADANLEGNNAYFFVCQKGNGSDGMITDEGIRVLLALGAQKGFPLQTGDRNTFGLTVNGQVLVRPETTEGLSGYAFIIK